MASVSFLPGTAVESVVLSVAFVVGCGLVGVVFWIASPMDVRAAKVTDEYQVRLIEWERDRVMSVAKGIAASSGGFIASLVVALLKDDVLEDVSVLSVLGCLLGGIGSLLLAAHLSMAAARFTLAGDPAQEKLNW